MTPGARPPVDLIAQAARLCYQDDQNDAEIAAQLGVCRRTLARWKRRGDFRAAWEALATAHRRRLRAELLEHARRRANQAFDERRFNARLATIRARTRV